MHIITFSSVLYIVVVVQRHSVSVHCIGHFHTGNFVQKIASYPQGEN